MCHSLELEKVFTKDSVGSWWAGDYVDDSLVTDAKQTAWAFFSHENGFTRWLPAADWNGWVNN